MDRISEDFCLVYFWGNPADLMPEKEHSKDHSLPAGRYVWQFTQPCIYISYTSPLSRRVAEVFQRGFVFFRKEIFFPN